MSFKEDGSRIGTGGNVTQRVETRDPAAAYNAKWENAASGGLYTGGTRVVETPLLGRAIRVLDARPGRRTVIEAAAGAGEQAIHIASALPRTNVVAIETSTAATEQMSRNLAEASLNDGSSLTVVNGDVLQSLDELDEESIDGFHANSFYHFLTERERRGQLERLQEVLRPDGIVAVSFKADGDALIQEAETVIVDKDDKGTYAVPRDGIQRLFVANPDAVATEFEESGLTVAETLVWDARGYDRPGEDSKFVGFLAKKAA